MFNLATYQEFLGIQDAHLHSRPTDRAALRALIALRSPLALAFDLRSWAAHQTTLITNANELAATEAYRATSKPGHSTLAPVLSTLTAEADHHIQMAHDELQRDPAQFAGLNWNNWQEKLPQDQWRIFVDAIYARYVLLNLPHSQTHPRQMALAVATGYSEVIAKHLQNGVTTPSQTAVMLATLDAARQFMESRKA